MKGYFHILKIERKGSLTYQNFQRYYFNLTLTTDSLCNLKNYYLMLSLSTGIQNNQNFHWEFAIFNIAKITLNEINIILKVILAAHFLFHQAYQYWLLLSFAIVILAIQFISYYLDFINYFELIDLNNLNYCAISLVVTAFISYFDKYNFTIHLIDSPYVFFIKLMVPHLLLFFMKLFTICYRYLIHSINQIFQLNDFSLCAIVQI